MGYTEHQRGEFRNQAAFLRGLAEVVSAYNETPGVKIDMHWLVDDLCSAAEECESEAEVVNS